MAFDPSTATEETKSSFDPSTAVAQSAASVPSAGPAPKTDERRKRYDLPAVGRETGIGALAGAFAPELVTGAGMLAGAFPPTMAAAPFIMGAGRAMRGARMASAAAGALSGASGEMAGQKYEKEVGFTPTADTARLLVSTIAPFPFEALATTGGRALTGAISAFGGTGIRTAKNLGELLQAGGFSPATVENLSAEKRAFIESQLAKLRQGGPRSVEAAKDIFGMLRQEAGQVTSAAEAAAFRFEQEADRLLKEVEGRQGVITADVEKRIANLRSQFDSAADRLRSDAQKEALTQVRAAGRRSEIIRRNAANKSEDVKRAAETQAAQIEAEAQRQAQELLRGAEKRVATLQSRYENRRQVIDSYRQRMRGEAETARGAVGERILPGELGTQVRQAFETRLSSLKEARDKAYETVKNTWLNTIRGKEQAGQTYRQTNAYKEALQNLNQELVTDTKMLRVTDPKSIEQVKSVISQINPIRESVDEVGNVTRKEVPASVQSLEVLLRRLKDRSGGLPAEGVEAIDQQRAGRLAEQVERIIDEFSAGTYKKAKDTYRELSKPINEFNTSVGKYVTQKPEGFDVGDFASRLGRVGPQVFENRYTAKQLYDVAGPEKSQELARGYLADKIGGEPTADKIKSVLETNRDWLALPEFKGIADQLSSAASQLTRAVSREKRSDILSKALKIKIEQLPGLPTKQAEKITGAAEKAAGKLRTAAEKEAGEIATKAERQVQAIAPKTGVLAEEAEKKVASGSKSVDALIQELLQEASKQRATVAKEGEAAVAPLTTQAAEARKAGKAMEDLLLGKAPDVERVEQFLTSGTRAEWEQISRVLGTQEGKEKVADAVSQIIARRYESSPKSAIDLLEKMGNNLTQYGLMDRSQIAALNKTMQEVYNAPVSQSSKASFMQRRIRDLILAQYRARDENSLPRKEQKRG